MLKVIQQLLISEGIELFAPLSLQDCRITRAYLLERAGITHGTAILLAVPYASPIDRDRNISAYAAVRDYHLYFKELFSRLLPTLEAHFPEHRFAGFADHSPIDEIDAALRAGLGVRGDNGLLLTKAYSSYVFLGEIITDTILPTEPITPGECHHCGACRRACPVELDKSRCLSALTQKKGIMNKEEEELLNNHPLVWGCDICQEVCPYTVEADTHGSLYRTPDFFKKDVIPHLTTEALANMDEETFCRRAYAWRGRSVIQRNLERKKVK